MDEKLYIVSQQAVEEFSLATRSYYSGVSSDDGIRRLLKTPFYGDFGEENEELKRGIDLLHAENVRLVEKIQKLEMALEKAREKK